MPIEAPVRHDSPYLSPLPHLYVEPTCNCWEFLKQFSPGTKVLYTNEGKFGHYAVVIKEEYGRYIVVESNYIPCEISYRWFYKNDKRILKVFYKQSLE